MMGVYIKGMEMPKNCAVCPFFVRSDSPKYPFVDCKLIGRLGSVFNAASGIPVDCPLVPVPPHGRLIDADEVEQDAQMRMLICNKNGNQFQMPYEVMRAIALAPIIIPAEEGEA